MAIALISATGGTLLQDFLMRRAACQRRQVQFVCETSLDPQAAIGGLAIATELIDGRKQSSGWWGAGERGTA
jgi:hypothetical protein